MMFDHFSLLAWQLIGLVGLFFIWVGLVALLAIWRTRKHLQDNVNRVRQERENLIKYHQRYDKPKPPKTRKSPVITTHHNDNETKENSNE